MFRWYCYQGAGSQPEDRTARPEPVPQVCQWSPAASQLIMHWAQLAPVLQLTILKHLEDITAMQSTGLLRVVTAWYDITSTWKITWKRPCAVPSPTSLMAGLLCLLPPQQPQRLQCLLLKRSFVQFPLMAKTCSGASRRYNSSTGRAHGDQTWWLLGWKTRSSLL